MVGAGPLGVLALSPLTERRYDSTGCFSVPCATGSGFAGDASREESMNLPPGGRLTDMSTFDATRVARLRDVMTGHSSSARLRQRPRQVPAHTEPRHLVP